MKSILIFLSLLLSLQLEAQFLEFGGSIGAFNYTGDLNRFPRPSQSNLAGFGVFRMNFSPVLSLKMGLGYGHVSGDDVNGVDILSEERGHSFKYGVLAYHSVFEFHFLDYRNEKKPNDWSPYAFMGVGFINLNDVGPTYEDFNHLQATIPAGFGVKYLVGKQFTLGAEIGLRKTFFDYLDGISDGDILIKDYQFGNPNDDDWFFYTGITLTYVLYKIPCPFPYIPNQSILMKIREH
ncbi:porin family protein [Marinoscillum sp. MHG1-6]|uniref:type IX secretion system protein PorG n=1 Tax=Marinoscillum sp. MHG1-6 TaxID=2959627 RepID=UPI0021572308|nr:porin family protein [Marinoscillum sp. MHG1-6]